MQENPVSLVSLFEATARVLPRDDDDLSVRKNQDGGRGGIRTHGGLPHARFRVECLKPDSATLPFFANRRFPALIINCTGVIVNSGLRKTGIQKCYNFRLASGAFGTAYCVSAGQRPLLLVVDSISQVISPAVHDYSHLIHNLNPLHRHDSTKTRNSACFT